MSNTPLLIFVMNLILSRFSGLKAVTKTAISYPMASKFRTGLTVAMFSLIIYTLMIFSVLNGLNDIGVDQPDRITGGYDIKGTISTENFIKGDVKDSLNMQDFTVVAGSSSIDVDAKETAGENTTFKGSKLVSVENSFISTNKWQLSYYDPKYGSSDREVWESLNSDPTLVLASGSIVETGDPFGPPDRSFKTSFIKPGDLKEIEAFNKKFPMPEHPVFRTHPDTGKKVIYVNRAFTQYIKGWEEDESKDMLDFLYSRASTPEYQCRFAWENNSIAFWDNRACQHYANSDYWPQIRRVERVTIVGDRPV
mgnify:CR=1 FL=1